MNRGPDNRLIQAMQQPCFYDHPVEQVELIETHISWVFLAGGYAYKVKKPVNFGFLDFSSLRKRQHFCQEELRLNRRFAPQLYLAVKTIGGGSKQSGTGCSATSGICGEDAAFSSVGAARPVAGYWSFE